MIARRTADPEPAGFGRCGQCAFLESGTPAICYGCARKRLEEPEFDSCQVCDLPFDSGGRCGNPICNWTEPRRQFVWNFTIAMRTGVLKDAINRYKYQDRKSWARVFGRVLLGFLTAHRETFASFNLLVASPTFVGAGGRSWDHVSLILQETETADEFDWFWLIDDLSHPAIIKSSATSSMMGKGWKERQEIAEGPLRTSLSVPDPSRTLGKRIIVFDDVFTCGSTLNEVARCLRTSGGAKEVCGVSLARQTWGGSD